MKKIKLFVITVLTALTFVSCGTTSTVPLTGRNIEFLYLMSIFCLFLIRNISNIWQRQKSLPM